MLQQSTLFSRVVCLLQIHTVRIATSVVGYDSRGLIIAQHAQTILDIAPRIEQMQIARCYDLIGLQKSCSVEEPEFKLFVIL